MLLDYGYRSECCYAAIRMGRKKVKNTKLTINVWVCCACKKSNVGIVKYTKNASAIATEPQVDLDDEPVID